MICARSKRSSNSNFNFWANQISLRTTEERAQTSQWSCTISTQDLLTRVQKPFSLHQLDYLVSNFNFTQWVMLLVSIIVEYQESLGGRCFSKIELLKDPLWRLYCNHLDWGMFLFRYKMSLVFSTTRAGNYVCVYTFVFILHYASRTIYCNKTRCTHLKIKSKGHVFV